MDVFLSTSKKHASQVYHILRVNGQLMFVRDGLAHWRKPYPRANIEKDIKEKNVFLAYQEGRYIATFTLSDQPNSHFTDGLRALYISKFAVLPEFGNRGIGSNLIHYIENYAISKGIKHLRLDVYDKNVIAINFYLKNGFKQTHTAQTKNFQVICMQKDII
jgi:ribosomal protein S18 acetylase RimI-like enzyme